MKKIVQIIPSSGWEFHIVKQRRSIPVAAWGLTADGKVFPMIPMVGNLVPLTQIQGYLRQVES